MNAQRKQLVTSILMLGVLSMIFSVLAFAEKTREDGHLPEQKGQGSGELTAFAVALGFSGLLVPVFRASGGGQDRATDTIRYRHQSVCGVCPRPHFFTGNHLLPAFSFPRISAGVPAREMHPQDFQSSKRIPMFMA